MRAVFDRHTLTIYVCVDIPQDTEDEFILSLCLNLLILVHYFYSNLSQWSLMSLKLLSVLHYLYCLSYYCSGLMKGRPCANSYSSSEARVQKHSIDQYKKEKDVIKRDI